MPADDAQLHLSSQILCMAEQAVELGFCVKKVGYIYFLLVLFLTFFFSPFLLTLVIPIPVSFFN